MSEQNQKQYGIDCLWVVSLNTNTHVYLIKIWDKNKQTKFTYFKKQRFQIVEKTIVDYFGDGNSFTYKSIIFVFTLH